MEYRKKILIVDDDPGSREVLNLYLKKAGYGTESVDQGRPGLDLLRERPHFDLVILDYRLPDMDGITLLDRIQELLEEPPPVLMLTAYSTTGLAVEFLKAGGIDFLEKPIREPEIILLKIQLALERHRRLQMEARNRMKSYRESILFSVGHEFRTPLTSIVTGLELLKDYRENLKPDEIQDTLEKMGNSVEQLTAMSDTITELIDLYNDLSDDLFLRVDAGETLCESLRKRRILIRLHEKGLALNHLLPINTPPIRGIQQYVEELFQRLLETLIRLTEKGSITLDATWTEDSLELYFATSGFRMEKKEDTLVLEDLESIDRSGHFPGSGLEFSLIWKLVERLKGKIRAGSSPEDGGLVLILSLPLWNESEGRRDRELFILPELQPKNPDPDFQTLTENH